MALMIFLPLALVVLAVLAAMAMIVKEDSRSRSLCERHAMILQSDLAQHLRSLLLLNPRARSLRKKLNSLKIQYAAAVLSGQEEVASAIETRIHAVKAEQLALNSEQLAIILSANSHVQSDADQWRYALRGMSPIIAQRTLQVTAVPDGQIAPEYKPVAHFSARQEMGARFHMTMAQMLSPFISSFLSDTGNPTGGIVKVSCGATIARQRSQYYARLWQPVSRTL